MIDETFDIEKETRIGHITPAGANIFLELGFNAEDAARYQSELEADVQQSLQIKQQLMTELSDWMAAEHLKQAEAAKILRVSRPRVSDVVNQKTAKFTIDALVQMLARTGKTVTLSVK